MDLWGFMFNLKVIGNLKTFIIMANIKTICLGTQKSKTDNHEIEVFATANDEISISIQGDALEYIYLDKSTAIKLSKILRAEINKI
jgi:hypothetical protein